MTLIGNKYHYSRPYTLDLKEFIGSRNRLNLYEYNRRKEEGGGQNDFKNLVSEIQFLDKLFSPVFGKDYIKLSVQGSVDLTLGVKINKIDNPT